MGQITKIVHGQELNPARPWEADRSGCLSVAGYFPGNLVDFEFDDVEMCRKAYHSLHYLLFENDDDVIADHLIYRDENKFESMVNKIAWDPPVKRAKNVSAFSYSCCVQDAKKLTHRVPLTLGISIFCFR